MTLSLQTDLLRDQPWTLVSIRNAWDKDWIAQPHLHADEITLAAAPDKSLATFHWAAGEMLRPGESEFKVVPPADLAGKWVKVEQVEPFDIADLIEEEIVPTVVKVLFLGRFEEDAAEYGGESPAPVIDQTILALGIEHQLDLLEVGGAYIYDPGDSGGDPPIEANVVRLACGLPFNELDGDGRLRGNRGDGPLAGFYEVLAGEAEDFLLATENPEADLVPLYGPDEEKWTLRDVIEYLLQVIWGGVNNASGNAIPAIGLSGQLDALVGEAEPVDPSGLSIWETLCRLVDRRRGLGCTIRYGRQPFWLPGGPTAAGEGYSRIPSGYVNEEAPDEPSLYIFTITESALTIETDDGTEMTVAGNPHSIVLDAAHARVRDHVFGKITGRRYGKIIVEGEPIVCCMTLSPADGTLRRGWTDADEAAYAEAGGGDPEQRDTIRSDDGFNGVFTTFLAGDPGVSAAGGGSFRFVVGDGEGGGNVTALPKLDENGELVLHEGSPVPATCRTWANAYRVLPRLPLRASMLLATDDPEAPDPEAEVEDGLLPPFAFAKDGTADGANRWFATHLGTRTVSPGHLRPLHDRFGLALQLRIPHLAAKNHEPAPVGEEEAAFESEIEPAFDYEHLAATVAVACDEPLRVYRTIEGGDPSRVLRIPVRGAEFHWIAPNAVVSIAGGAGGAPELRRWEDLFDSYAPANSILRNDAPRLRRVLERATVWHGRTRGRVSYGVIGFDAPEVSSTIGAGGQPAADPEVGAVIGVSFVGYDIADVDTPITSITFDCYNGMKRVATSYVEPEVR